VASGYKDGQNIISTNITAIRSEYQVNTVGSALIRDSRAQKWKAAERTEMTRSNKTKRSVGKRKLHRCNKFITHGKARLFEKGLS